MPFELDPDVVDGLKGVAAKVAGIERPALDGTEGVRAMVALTMGSDQPPPIEVSRKDVSVTSFDGAEIPARWYWKDDVSDSAAVLYLHGGGRVAGSIDVYDRIVSDYVLRAGVPMLSIGYRLAPEFGFPLPQEDCYSGLCWLAEHAEELGVDPGRIAVMGDSAGGGFAASAALLARDRYGPRISRQILIYPSLDDRQLSPEVHLLKTPQTAQGYERSKAGWDAHLQGRAGAHDIPTVAAPGRLKDATGLPPAYIEAGEVDVVRADGVEYAKTLWRSGVSVELHVHPGCPHGYDVFAPDASVTARALADRTRVLNAL